MAVYIKVPISIRWNIAEIAKEIARIDKFCIRKFPSPVNVFYQMLNGTSFKPTLL